MCTPTRMDLYEAYCAGYAGGGPEGETRTILLLKDIDMPAIIIKNKHITLI